MIMSNVGNSLGNTNSEIQYQAQSALNLRQRPDFDSAHEIDQIVTVERDNLGNVATESFGNLVVLESSNTLPGASVSRRFDDKVMANTV